MKIMTIVGARPQFIKASPLSKILRESGSIEELLVHTGQHYDHEMSKIFFDELGIPQPEVNLGVGSGSHAVQTAAMLCGLEEIMQKYLPNWVLIYGDTNSTLAGVLAAAKLNIPVAHVESGLRSFNKRMPEEINRIVADSLSELLFAPTEAAFINLKNEGISEERIHFVGDVMYDAAIYYAKQAEQKSKILQNLGLYSGKYILATIHRAENTDNSMHLETIVNSLCQIALEYPVVLPLHPRTKVFLQKSGILEKLEKSTKLIEPVGYLDMIKLEKNAMLIATDSGGVQKEAFFYRIPCVTLRYETEWLELLELGWNRLCPPLSVKSVVDGIISAIGTKGDESTPYGKGDAAQYIVRVLKSYGHSRKN